MNIPFTNLGQLFDHAAAQYGDKLLWKSLDDSSTLSFSDFASKSKAFAGSLSDIGVKRGHHVAVMLPSVTAFAITWAAIARLGAIIVPANYQYTSAELGYVLNDSDARFLIIDEKRVNVLTQIAPDSNPVADSQIVLHGAPDKRFKHNWQEMLHAAPTTSNGMPNV